MTGDGRGFQGDRAAVQLWATKRPRGVSAGTSLDFEMGKLRSMGPVTAEVGVARTVMQSLNLTSKFAVEAARLLVGGRGSVRDQVYAVGQRQGCCGMMVQTPAAAS